MAFTLTIQTPESSVFEGEITSVQLKTEQGNMEVFPGHAPLQGTISFSRTVVKQADKEETYLLRQGMIFVDHLENTVRILAYAANKASEIDTKTAQEYLDMIKESLAKKEDLNKYQIQFLEESRIAVEESLEN